jgi:phenylpropionate dioxygenase-like ring-hydroxylating dioxygenase large terminal subunit
MSAPIRVYDMPVINPSKPQARWPFTHNPKGWYMIALSDELKTGDVKPLQYFGQDLVLFRDEEGAAHLLDAFCPHMGAHLGYGGVVKGTQIKCPFHAWQFDGKGQCQHIPYGEKIPKRAQIKSWDVCEKNGLIMAWCNEEGSDPEWEIPLIEEYGSDEWTSYETREFKIKTHCIEMGENQVDTAHFKYLHGVTSFPDSSCETDGPFMHVHSKTHMDTPKGEMVSTIDSQSWGFGFSVVRFTGIVDTMIVSSTTPMDGESVHTRFNFMIKKTGDADSTKGVGKAFIDEVSGQLEQDRPIWEHKVYIKPPNLCDGDGPVAIYRRWCKQFFPEGSFTP